MKSGERTKPHSLYPSLSYNDNFTLKSREIKILVRLPLKYVRGYSFNESSYSAPFNLFTFNQAYRSSKPTFALKTYSKKSEHFFIDDIRINSE